MNEMLFHTFQDNDLGIDAHIIEAFFKLLKLDNTAPLFELGWSKYTQLGTTMLLYNMKEKYGMSTCFSAMLR